MIKKIIIVHENFFRKHRDMGIDLFLDKGYEVELWSTVRIKYGDRLKVPSDIIELNVIYINNHLELLKKLYAQKWNETILFITTTFHRGGVEDFIRVFSSIFGGRYCNFIYEFVPVGPGLSKYQNKFYIFRNIINKFLSIKVRTYQFFIKRIFKPTFSFVTTIESTKQYLTEVERKTAVEVHNKDYDEFILNNNSKCTESQYIVFIDTGMVNAEDFRKINANPIYPNENIYYENLNKDFSRFEEYYQAPVVIAAHPKSEFHGEFGERKVIYYKTAELVRDAVLVLMHSSCAVNFVILYEKPYVFLIDKYIRSSAVWGYLVEPMIKELNAKTYDIIEEKTKLSETINYPNSTFRRYLHKWIIHDERHDKLYYQIVEEHIRKLI